MRKLAFNIPVSISRPPLSVWLTVTLCLLTIFLGNPLSISAQSSPHPFFRQYTTDDGLASPEVFCILQDPKGFIWIATDNGISRFDGYQFRNYGVKDGLLENVIFEMHLDTLGRIWMQAMSGNLYYLEGEKMLPYWNNNVLQGFKNRPDNGKGFIVEGAGEVVHIATLKYGVISISKEGAAITYAKEDSICSQVFEKNGQAIYALSNRGGAATTLTKPSTNISYYPTYFYDSAAVWAFPDLFYSKTKILPAEAFRLDKGKYLFQIFDKVWLIENGKALWQHTFPYNILSAGLMNDGQLFVGLYGHKGLRIFRSIEDFRKEEGGLWLPGKSVNYFMEDREGGQWFATHEDGVFYAPAEAFMVYDQSTGLSDEKVTALAIKNKKEGYVGLENGEVWSFNLAAKIWKKLPELPDNGFLRDLYFDPFNQRLWAGRKKLFYLENNTWQQGETSDEVATPIIPNRIQKSPDGKRLWLCNSTGFRSIELSKKKSTNIHSGPDQRTLTVREDFEGRIWVGQSKGLYEWKDSILYERQSLHPAFSLRVEDIALLPDSTLVVATKGGGIVFWKNQQFEQITTEQGLTADMMECVYVDSIGVVWAGTLNGLNRISGTWGNREVEQITIAHGLPSNEINRISTFGENVWVATNKGLVHFSNKKQSHFSPKPILASVLANNHSINLTQSIELPYIANNLTIHFFAINYKMNGKIHYRYRMDEGAFSYTYNRSLNFPELPPGKRLFEVQAQNEDGLWSESTSFKFIIHPPWWNTWWAKTLMLASLVAGAIGFYLFRTRKLKEAHQIQLQIADLERSALQAQMNPHFIFNCLNSIQNYILQNEKEAAILYLGSFASLVRSMLNASVAGKISLTEEIKLLNNYLELEKLRFKNRFTYEVKTAKGVDVFGVKIPPLLVQPFVENAVKHGISSRIDGGKVTILFEEKGNYLEVIITDNGSGWQAKDGVLNKNKEHKSFGMSITKDRLELLSGNSGHLPDSFQVVNTKNIFDENNAISGTEVTIRIDVRKMSPNNR